MWSDATDRSLPPRWTTVCVTSWVTPTATSVSSTATTRSTRRTSSPTPAMKSTGRLLSARQNDSVATRCTTSFLGIPSETKPSSSTTVLVIRTLRANTALVRRRQFHRRTGQHPAHRCSTSTGTSLCRMQLFRTRRISSTYRWRYRTRISTRSSSTPLSATATSRRCPSSS